ncbi:MAG: glycosyltransferase family 9 protein [Deltaproteobacteria bacterium]|nr:MAG: glycosyltransferase family 9 protein [Deltaproteobacteria bacterium]
MDDTSQKRKREAVKPDCRYFLGDRPCRLHKEEGIQCRDCARYSPATKRVLVIKLGAMGDVLRTTSILPALHKQHKEPHITWITEEDSVDFLVNNPLVDSLMGCVSGSLARLQVETFDLVINPESTRESAALASISRSKDKKGFGLSPNGFVFPFNRGAEEIFYMGLFDDVKKQNQKTYEELICQVSDLLYERVPPTLRLTEGELRVAEEFVRSRGIVRGRPVVGINTGGGVRWPLKRWTLEGFVSLAREISSGANGQVLLLGGPTEEEINRVIVSELGGTIIDTGCFNSPRGFSALINLCDVVVTGDSLALHIGLALNKRMVVLFGPTSATEIDLYGLGEKVTSEMDCLCCYRQTCDQSPNCMENISVERVYQAVERQIDFSQDEPK